MKSNFVLDLERKQCNFLFEHELSEDQEYFFLRKVKFSICKEYEIPKEEKNRIFRYVSHKLGVGILVYDFREEKYLEVFFRGSDGFECHDKFYECLCDIMLERINNELVNVLKCERWKEYKRKERM